MAKFAGIVGYSKTEETSPGVWTPVITERTMRGDVITAVDRNEPETDKLSTDLKLNNRLSLIADGYAYKNYGNIVYVEFQGVKWRVSAVEIKKPRLLVNFGGIYHER